MESFKKIFLRIGLLIVLVGIVIFAVYVDSQRTKDIAIPMYGTPVTYSGDIDISSISMDQIVDDKTYLYILDQYDGKVYVFDLQGTYQYTLMFYDYINGSFRIAVSADGLYVRDPHHDVYCYRDGQFVSFSKRDDAKDILSKLDFECNSDNYIVRYGSVYRISADEDVCIIKRDISAIKYQEKFYLLVTLVVVALIGLFRFRKTGGNFVS